MVLLEVEAEVVEVELLVADDVVHLNRATMKTHLPATILASMKGPNTRLHNSC